MRCRNAVQRSVTYAAVVIGGSAADFERELADEEPRTGGHFAGSGATVRPPKELPYPDLESRLAGMRSEALARLRLRQMVMEEFQVNEEEKWIQGAEEDIEKRGTEGVCTGKKFGGPTCRAGTKRYNLAKTFRKMAKKRKKKKKE